jgi:hypothetical protein
MPDIKSLIFGVAETHRAAAQAAHDARQPEVDRLKKALEPFADVCGDGDEDMPDNTPVTITYGRTTYYSITLGDFRKARAAIRAAEGAEQPIPHHD